MCDLSNDNLIDLSLDDGVSCNNAQNQTEFHPQLPESTTQFVPPSWSSRNSLGNNPFDSVQKLANRLSDPFDAVENKASLKAKKPAEIKLGNLLSFSEDNLLNIVQQPSNECLNNDLGLGRLHEIDLESPPITLNEKYRTDSVSGTDTTSNSSAETSASAKLKKNMEHRKLLLKLSISNSALSSPAVQRDFNGLDDVLVTPVSSLFSSQAVEFEENLLSAESPLKFVEDEDKLSQEPQTLIDSEKKFEADLEMLTIPILNDLPSPVMENTRIKSDESDVVSTETSTLDNTLPDLEAIKTKLRARKSEINSTNRYEIYNLIENLKALISSGEMVDERKRLASNLLESLTSALIPSNIEYSIQNSQMLDVPPQPITRQSTFDLEIPEKQEINVDKQQLLQEIPACMISSSATYDGETPAEKQDYSLPEIAPLTPRSSLSPNRDLNNMQYNMNDIVEQLSKLLINNSSNDQTNINNPTLIVVMNTNQINNSNIDDYKQNVSNVKARSGFVANYLENSVNGNSSPDWEKSNSLPRRRSQSLSIHDKIKVVHLPLHPSTSRPMQKLHSIQTDDLSPIKMTPPSNGKGKPELKTPAKLRRNSYSSGTPHTAQVGLRRTSTDAKNSQMRKAHILDTHHESEQHVINRPLSNNLTKFKPDFKKKIKPKVESIMKSSGPLKATIPVKKVAPMIKSSSPSPEKNLKTKIGGTPITPFPNRIPKLGVGDGYPNACSTPAEFATPLKRSTGPINKSRYAYISTTPNANSSLANSSTASLKRRTINEAKAKSPLKPRTSNSGLQIRSSSRGSTGSSRLSIAAGAKNCKNSIKVATNTDVVKSSFDSSRASTRLSVGGSLLSNRNKENKRL